MPSVKIIQTISAASWRGQSVSRSAHGQPNSRGDRCRPRRSRSAAALVPLALVWHSSKPLAGKGLRRRPCRNSITTGSRGQRDGDCASAAVQTRRQNSAHEIQYWIPRRTVKRSAPNAHFTPPDLTMASLPPPGQNARRPFLRPSSRSACRYVSLAICIMGAICILIPSTRLGWEHELVQNHDSVAGQLVQDAFRHAFGSYMQLAFPRDELRPVSNTSRDKYVLQ
jgi:hypothetical protein